MTEITLPRAPVEALAAFAALLRGEKAEPRQPEPVNDNDERED